MTGVLNTRRKLVHEAELPPVRKSQCERCPFGPNLNVFEMFQVSLLKDRLRANLETLWVCHETAGMSDDIAAKALLCPGFVAWRDTLIEKETA